jgi:hypothetical protein
MVTPLPCGRTVFGQQWSRLGMPGKSVLLSFGILVVCLGVGATLLPRTTQRSEGAVDLADILQGSPQKSSNLRFEGRQGYLLSLLEALDVPVESQVAVFSKTSLQSRLIEPKNPRAIYFNDSVAVAWPPGGFIELAIFDSAKEVRFYTLEQRQQSEPRFARRRQDCLSCHVDGMIVRSTLTTPSGEDAANGGVVLVDHRTLIEQRWGGWYVTDHADNLVHLGSPLPSLDAPGFTGKYLAPYSDAAALLVLDHQMAMTNRMIRIHLLGSERSAAVEEFVDYLLFIDEAPLPAKIVSTSGFAQRFSEQGIRDRKGRSLRDLDLERRLLRYPCSYMIYSPAFNSLSQGLKEAIYRRMWLVLSGKSQDPKYSKLTASDRHAIVEILEDTKPELRPYFR